MENILESDNVNPLSTTTKQLPKALSQLFFLLSFYEQGCGHFSTLFKFLLIWKKFLWFFFLNKIQVANPFVDSRLNRTLKIFLAKEKYNFSFLCLFTLILSLSLLPHWYLRLDEDDDDGDIFNLRYLFWILCKFINFSTWVDNE